MRIYKDLVYIILFLSFIAAVFGWIFYEESVNDSNQAECQSKGGFYSRDYSQCFKAELIILEDN